MKKIIFLIIFTLLVGGCAISHTGPYVTNISSDGAGGLVIEKCMTRYDPWMATIGTINCTSTNIRLYEIKSK